MKAKTLTFYLIAITLPFVVLLALEMLLRAISYGNDYPLFVEAEGFENHLQPNPEVIKRFFNQPSLAPQVAPDTYIFPSQKPAETLRIVTMGGSTMAGFPYGRFGSPAGMLQQIINAQHPEMKVEIISVAISSINSYSILDFVDEVVDIQADVVLLYMGHNEYLGVMGASSNLNAFGGRANTLLFLKLKELKLYQLMQDLVFMFKQAEQQKDAESRTLMAKVAQNQEIHFNSETYQLGKQQLEENLSLIINGFRQHNIPLYVSNLAANERDQVPFKSVSDTELDRLSSMLNEKLNRAQFLLDKEAVKRNQSVFHADFSYAMAKGLSHAEKYTAAKSFFQAAKDYDLLRFRAPSEFNQIIKKVSEDNNATFVDAQSYIRKDTEHGIIGNEHMLEHLHPNIRGYFLIALAFYESLLNSDLLPESYYRNQYNADEIFRFQAVSKSEQIYAEYSIEVLTSDYPFTKIRKQQVSQLVSPEIRQIAENRIDGQDWIKNQQALFSALQQEGNYLDAAIVAGNLYHAIPGQYKLAKTASMLFLNEQALALAEYYARQALLGDERDISMRLSFAEILYRTGRAVQAIEQLDKVLQLDPNNQVAITIRARISQ